MSDKMSLDRLIPATQVHLGMNVRTGELLAVKQIELSRLTAAELSALEQELVVLRELRHEHIGET
jgi:hypothetical protein